MGLPWRLNNLGAFALGVSLQIVILYFWVTSGRRDAFAHRDTDMDGNTLWTG